MPALANFQVGVAEVRVLVASVLTDPPEGTARSDRDNAIHRAAVVLLVSHFEGFLKTLAEDFTDVAGAGHLESRQIPRGIRELHTLPRLGEILESGDDAQRGALLRKLNPVMALWNDDAKPPKGTLSPELVSRSVTNGDSKTIDRLFKLMGSTTFVCDGDLDVEDAVGDITPTSIRLALSDVIGCRNDIAHGDQARLPTDADVDRYLRFLTTLAGRLSRKAQALVELVSA